MVRAKIVILLAGGIAILVAAASVAQARRMFVSSDAFRVSQKSLNIVVDPGKTPGIHLGVPGGLSGLIWLNSVSKYGDWYMKNDLTPEKYDYLARQISIVSALEPMARQPFLFSGSVLLHYGDTIRETHKTLLYSLEGQTGYWELYFWLGALYYFNYGDQVRAGKWWQLASLLPESPPYLTSFSQLLILTDGQEIAEEIADLMLAQRRVPEYLKNEIRDIRLFQQQKRVLEQDLARYEDRFRHRPVDLTTLVQRGVWDEIPIDPWGGQVKLSQDGRHILPSERAPAGQYQRGATVPIDPDLERGHIR